MYVHTFPVLVLTRRAVESSDPDITRVPSECAARQLTGPAWPGDMEQVVVHSFRFHTLTPPSSYPQHMCLPFGMGGRGGGRVKHQSTELHISGTNAGFLQQLYKGTSLSNLVF